MPTVSIALWPLNQLGPHRIEVNVTNQGKKVFIFFPHNSPVSSLKEMTDLVLDSIEVLGVELLESLHESGKRDRGGRY
jgi:hypothetical protein